MKSNEEQCNICRTDSMLLSELQIHVSKLQGIFCSIDFTIPYHIFQILAWSPCFTDQKGRQKLTLG